MSKQIFSPNFKSPAGVIDIDGLNGYIQALRQLQDYLENKTKGYTPANRLLDTTELLNAFRVVFPQIADLLDEAHNSLTSVKDQLVENISHKLPLPIETLMGHFKPDAE